MSKLAEQIAAIEAMSARERKAEWRRVFGTSAPPAFGSGLLARALAYRVQEQATGGLGKTQLRRIAAVGSKSGDRKPPSPSLKPGTWLSRTWHGETHLVIVLESGFEYRDQRYISLSAVAKTITGAAWSGPRFFGLHSPRLGRLGVSASG
ncbi:DUF2924 domain-containing protein [Croceicoccus sp. BE223]|uniref:DUF2924 domain-containing protein n=1 Tax=Croceicoccus sp. BE223 TaxID=2817716 RepID=UPI00285D7383|nr:DUF2924 domain-containing protein [Croceicoccus sp. BE223]MDR7102845.1 hypothetical protein [Croceicoccus sp. BE223]